MQTAVLLEMLMARKSGSRPDLTQLMSRLNAGHGGQSTHDMLAHMAQANPRAAMLLKQLNLSHAEASDHIVEGEAIEVDSAGAADAAGDGATEADYSGPDDAAGIQAELDAARERVDQCAAALGACGACWGTDSTCRACRGRGRPGFCLPDEALFELLILPAVRMLRAQRASAASRSYTLSVRTPTRGHGMLLLHREETDHGTRSS